MSYYLGEFVGQYLDYSTLKMLHMVGIILFMGNIIITGWWKTMADKTRDPRIIAFAQHQVTVTDWIFTFGGVLMVLAGGFGMVFAMNDNIMEEIYDVTWLWWGYHLFLISGIIWAVILIPLQIALARMAREFAVTGDIPARYWTYSKAWLWFGILATVIPLANVYWMVLKP